MPRDELLETVWPEETVTQSSINQAVRGARRALCDDGDPPRWIATVRGRGYRFVGEVSVESGTREEMLGRADELRWLRDAWEDPVSASSSSRGRRGWGRRPS